jgi:HlyD family secretion protein
MKSFRSVLSAPREAAPDLEIRRFQSETAEILNGPEPVQLRVTLFALVGMFAVLLIVAITMRVDRVVTSTYGQIASVDPTIVLQALDQSIIKSLNVKEGERVKEGQVLATLDPTFTSADVGALKAQLANLDAQIARAKAELAQKPFDYPVNPDAGLAAYGALQRAYYAQRKAQFDAQVRAYDEQIGQYKTTIAKYRNDEQRFADRARISKEIEDMRASLHAAQVGSRLNLLAATDQRLEVLRNLEYGRNAAAEAQHQLDATSATRAAYVQQWFGQTSQELVTAQQQRDTAAEQLAKASKHQELVRMTAPEEAIVYKMAKVSVQSVLNQGEALLYLAPLKSALEGDIRIAARDIGFVRPGDPVTVKLEPFNFVEHGTAEGKLRWISEGAFTTDDNNQPTEPYYRARVALDAVSLRNVPPGFRLVPGMTLSADIHIGTRSLIMYLMRGIVRGLDESMREP